MKPTIALIHGINAFNGGKATTGRMRPYYEAAGYEVIELKYRWILWLGTYIFNRSLAKKFAKILNGKEVIFVCHSNGNVIANIATERYGVNAKGLIAINPALDSDTVFPKTYEFIHVYHNKCDLPTKIAKWIPAHPWGSMGRNGYIGKDKRVSLFNTYVKQPKLCGHSAWYEGESVNAVWTNFTEKHFPEKFRV